MCAGLHSLGNILSLGSRTCFAQRVHKFTAFNFEGQKVAFSNKMQREVLQEADFEEGSEGVWWRSFKLKFGCGKYPQRFHTSFVSLKLGVAVARLKTQKTTNPFFASKKPLSEDSHHPMSP